MSYNFQFVGHHSQASASGERGREGWSEPGAGPCELSVTWGCGRTLGPWLSGRPSPLQPSDPMLMAAESKTKIIYIYCHCSKKWGGSGGEGRAGLKTMFEKVDSRRQRKQSGRRLPFHRPAGVLHSCHKCLLSFEAKSNTIWFPGGL